MMEDNKNKEHESMLDVQKNEDVPDDWGDDDSFD